MTPESAPKLESQEDKLAKSLAAINPVENGALKRVKQAISENLNWSVTDIEKLQGVIDTIADDFRQIIVSSSTEGGKRSLYAEIQNYIEQLPETAGLREKVREIVSIPEFEEN